MTDTADDGYAGPAELIAGDGTVVAVQVKLAGQFEPVAAPTTGTAGSRRLPRSPRWPGAGCSCERRTAP